MLIGIQGFQGSGKSLTMSVLGLYLRKITQLQTYANYKVVLSLPFNSFEKLFSLQKAIVLFDELWLNADSRKFKDNIFMTQWINQCRKKAMCVLYTTQAMDQVDYRIRRATDVVINCDRTGSNISIVFIDNHTFKILRKFTFNQPERFYTLFDSYQVLQQFNPLATIT